MSSQTRKKIIEALERTIESNITEGRIKYKATTSERILPKLEEELRERRTSLGIHPIFPESDETHFEEKIISKRFEEVVGRVKRNFDVETINDNYIKTNMMGLVRECSKLESGNEKILENLAEDIIRKEYDISKDDVDIIVELTNDINLDGTQKNPSPIQLDEIEFDDHQSIEDANGEVYKRRFINAMIQGSAKKSSHMFNMYEDELYKINPRLLNKYGKMMSAADYMYYIIPDMDNGVSGGVVKVTFPTKEGEKPIIHAKAMLFPVLIHELVKGVMELLSSHGLPSDNKLKEYVIGKSDYVSAEPWDMRLGPAIWEKFVKAIPPEDFKLKHHVYSEIVSLPVNEFNSCMREIMAGTKAGKKIIIDLLDDIKSDLKKEEFDQVMSEKRNGYKNIIDDPNELDNIDLSDFGL